MLKIGDKCKVIKCHLRPTYIGQEVEIVNIHTMKNGTILYEIREKDNENLDTVAAEDCLKLIENV